MFIIGPEKMIRWTPVGTVTVINRGDLLSEPCEGFDGKPFTLTPLELATDGLKVFQNLADHHNIMRYEGVVHGLPAIFSAGIFKRSKHT